MIETCFETIVDWLRTKCVPSLAYDLVKFMVWYLLARLFYERVFKWLLYRNWTLLVKRGEEVLATRRLTPDMAERFLRNENDLSVYVKGVISPHEWLRMDICSPEAKETGLFLMDKKKRAYTVDLGKNPKKRDGPSELPSQRMGHGQC